jgi:hypothetical protein
MEANGRLGKEAQKLLIALSCAIVRMENKHPEGTDTSRNAAPRIQVCSWKGAAFLDASIISCSSEW